MIAIQFDISARRFRVFGSGIDLLLPAGADPLGFADMARNKVLDETGVSLQVVRL